MWIYDRDEEGINPYTQYPFTRIRQISYLPKPLPWLCYPHFHADEYELAFIADGSGRLNLPGVSLSLKKGCISLTPPAAAHCYLSDPEPDQLRYFTLRLYVRDGSPQADEFARLGTVLAENAHIGQIERLFQITREQISENGGRIDASVQTLCQAILEIAKEDFRRRGQQITTFAPEYANDILLYLQNHTHEKVTLAALAEHFALSPSHLSRVFSRAYHISPISYLIYSRMREARTCILNEHMEPAAIAKRLAYHNVTHFSNAFRQFYGCRPEEYHE